MAQLKSTVVQGSLRVTDTTYTTDLVVSDVTAPTIANNDYLLVADASDGNKLLKGPIFDGSTTSQALTKRELGQLLIIILIQLEMATYMFLQLVLATMVKYLRQALLRVVLVGEHQVQVMLAQEV